MGDDVSLIYLCIKCAEAKTREHFKNENRNQLHKSEKTLSFFLLKVNFYNLENVNEHNFFRTVWQYLSILKTHIPFEQVISLLEMYPMDTNGTFQQN